jgi:transcriptional regulator with XRE-family HTH domain
MEAGVVVQRRQHRQVHVEIDELMAALVARREELRLTQVEVARRMQVSQAFISNIENARDLKVSTVMRYARALGVLVDITVTLAPPPAPDGTW